MQVACCFSNRMRLLEYYHNSSHLEHGGAPEKAVKVAFVSQIDAVLKQQGKYLKNESKITFQDVEDCLILVSSSFSTQTSYENQTKKSITNKFIYEAMTDFLKHSLEVYFIENPMDAAKIADQVLVNKRSRENAEKTRLNLKKKLAGSLDIANRVQKFVDCRTKDIGRPGNFYRGRRFCARSLQAVSRCGISGDHPGAGQNFKLPESGVR